MEMQHSIVGRKIVRLLQTPSRPIGVILEEFGEAYSMELVAILDDGRAVQINEYDWGLFEGDLGQLVPAKLVQNEYSLSDIEGQTIIAEHEIEWEWEVRLANGLCINCSGAPGGNFPWILSERADS